MKRALLLFVAPLLISIAGCGAWLTVDGFEAERVQAPADIERGTRYSYHGTTVYEGADHRYYRQHEGGWVRYRERPHDLGQPAAEPKREEPKREEPKREEPRKEGERR